ncbi:hypothetical protein [Chelatococcus reniformis]|uniref:Uncharacterized protein n=1 Tax=Chelatococcus reniformis TaxID=1494448 RepID=A0A916XL27_9HYPH|nr:hypothetical protein [Chelatococcus reniformis]GGC82714.1 hypothetical protein GCM10010994_45770 [Chelatococcus reniformis]
MNSNDPIRMSDLRRAQAATSSVTRIEAERQFKLSFALVAVLTMATLTAMATVPMSGWGNGNSTGPQVASTTAIVR